MLVPQLPWMAVHMSDERLRSRVRHLHRPSGFQRQQASVRLHRQVLPSAEGSADACHRQVHLLPRQPQHGRQLLLVDVKPLRRDVELDAPVVLGHGETRLRSKRRLVLHADLVFAGDDYVGPGGLVAVPDLHLARDVPVGMELRRVGRQRSLGVGDRVQHLVVDLHRLRRAPRLLGMIGGHQRDRLAPVAHDLVRQHRPVTSLWVSTTCTPGIARAAEMSIALMRAYGCGLRAVAPHSMSGACRSDEYSKRPRTLAAPSGLGTLSPTFICGPRQGSRRR